MMCRSFAYLALLVAVLSPPAKLLAAPTVGKTLTKLEVADFRGRVWTMDDFADADIMVVVFLGTECPLAKLYAGRVDQLAKLYEEKGVRVIAVMSNRQDSIAEIAAFARQQELTIPVLKDVGNVLADALGAERTPEAFVLDRQRQVRYWGRIDDQYGIGYQKDAPEKFDLVNAVDDLLAGKEPRQPITRSVGCILGRQKKTDTHSTVTFSNQVIRIINRRCVECHREGEIAPFALDTYEEAAGWADMMAEVVREKRMPPWHANPAHGSFINDRSLTDEEKQTFYDWADAGAPEGDVADLPSPPTFVSGWQLPREPDLIVQVSPEPFEVPAEGEVKYKYFFADPKFEEERWIEAAELLPGNRAVVHHILCFVRPKGTQGNLGAERGFLVGYVPGARVHPNPAGMAKRIPANSEFVFQVHYTPIGTAQFDQSKLALVFADTKTITHEVVTSSAVQPRFRIPPHDGNYRVDAVTPEKLTGAQLLSFSPHMHLRGKAFRYELVGTGGERSVLLDIPQYDFNWQTTYELPTPMTVEDGSRIACTAYFDNSEKNLNNPDPDSEVRWGDQTWEEMMIGYFHYAVPLAKDEDSADAPGNRARNLVRNAARLRIFDALDPDGDDSVTLDSVPARFKDAAKQLDANKDGLLTRSEVESAP